MDDADMIVLNSSTWVPEKLVQNKESLIWTERFLQAGDFTLVSKDIEWCIANMPPQKLVTMRDTDEVCIVENHEIVKGADGAPAVKVTGRSYDVIMEQRCTYVVLTYGPNPGGNILVYGVDNKRNWDIARLMANWALITPPLGMTENRIPRLTITATGFSTATALIDYQAKPGELYQEIVRILDLAAGGIRNTLTQSGSLGYINMQFYRGVNRSVNQSTRKAVIFSTQQGHIIDPKILMSIKDYKNEAYVYSDFYVGRVQVPGSVKPFVGVSASGWGEAQESTDNAGYLLPGDDFLSTDDGQYRRILHVDATDLKSAGSWSPSQLMKQRGLKELAKHNRVAFIDGEIAADTDLTYKVDYELGDTVTLMGPYGVSQDLVVSEFTRSWDETGYRTFPTVSSPQKEQ